MSAFWPVWAQGFGDRVVILIIVLFIIISVVGQLLARLREQPRPPQPPQPDEPLAGPQQKTLEGEIGEFLRRAAQRRGAPGPAAPNPPRRPAERPVRAEVIPEAPTGRQVAKHVQEHLSAEELARRTAQLGREVAKTEAEIGTHLRQTFERQVSRLAARGGEEAAAPAGQEAKASEGRADAAPTLAVGLAALLTNPDNIRQAIVINEILRRPQWD